MKFFQALESKTRWNQINLYDTINNERVFLHLTKISNKKLNENALVKYDKGEMKLKPHIIKTQ